jgi:hypothetical protein
MRGCYDKAGGIWSNQYDFKGVVSTWGTRTPGREDILGGTQKVSLGVYKIEINIVINTEF